MAAASYVANLQSSWRTARRHGDIGVLDRLYETRTLVIRARSMLRDLSPGSATSGRQP